MVLDLAISLENIKTNVYYYSIKQKLFYKKTSKLLRFGKNNF